MKHITTSNVFEHQTLSEFEQQAQSELFDDLIADLDSGEQTFVNNLEYTDDPLALVCAMLRANRDVAQIFRTLEGAGRFESQNQIQISNVIVREDREQAVKIRKHFRNKILMRRMKSMNISRFMLAVEELLTSPQKIKRKNIGPLVKLPYFYDEDKTTENIFNSHETLPKNRIVQDLDFEIEYVGTVRRRTSKQRLDIQYWSTSENHLVQIELPSGNIGQCAWELLSKQRKIKIKAKFVVPHKVLGYDFFVYHLNKSCEIELVENH